ncbi:zinc ABC transporter ATP-binding protein [Bacteroidia bacterium]|nr:zinc ABC transporter ATP-binding protein [Bacteroidia bacterium]
MNLIELHNISAGYDGKTVLQAVNLTIEEGDFLGIIGPNGGGKTTLLKVILGLIKPQSGEIVYPCEQSGHNCSRKNNPCQTFWGYLPQNNPIDKKFPISVTELVFSGMLSQKGLFGRYRKTDKQKVYALLEHYGLENYLKAPINDLSGGQLQRALLCRAVIASPKVLILDEPMTFVDSDFEDEFYGILKELNKTVTIVMVSHDINTIQSVAKRTVYLNHKLSER